MDEAVRKAIDALASDGMESDAAFDQVPRRCFSSGRMISPNA